MNRPLLAVSAAIALAGVSAPARAMILVYDPAALAKLIDQAKTAADQLEQLKSQVTQAQRLYDGFAQASNVNQVASRLASPALRAFLPDAATYAAAAQGNLTALGALGQKAAAIRSTARIYTPPAGDPIGADLEATGNRAARDLALGQSVSDVSAQRLQGLQQLQASLDTAPNARAVLDLQARLGAEQAMIANDQVRLQGLAMAQSAEDRLQQQRDRERATKTHADAEAAFRSMIQ